MLVAALAETALRISGAVGRSISATHMGSSSAPTDHLYEFVPRRDGTVLKSRAIKPHNLFHQIHPRVPQESENIDGEHWNNS
jgi:hypothetical protein